MTDNSISTSIGSRFERILQQQFPDFLKREDENNNPDFLNGQFWVEAKTGFWDFGVQIKEYQITAFQRLKEPVIYAIGFHNFNNAMKRLARKSTERRDELLDSAMSIQSTYFVSDSVINSIWNMENKTSKKEKRVYCTLKQRFLDAIIQDTSFTRSGINYPAREYYRLNHEDYLMQSPSLENPTGVILNHKQDKPVIDYLIGKNLINLSF